MSDFNRLARRTSIFHAINKATLFTEDMREALGGTLPEGDQERLMLLTRRQAQITEAVLHEDRSLVRDALLMLGADVFGWLEELERAGVEGRA